MEVPVKQTEAHILQKQESAQSLASSPCLQSCVAALSDCRSAWPPCSRMFECTACRIKRSFQPFPEPTAILKTQFPVSFQEWTLLVLAFQCFMHLSPSTCCDHLEWNSEDSEDVLVKKLGAVLQIQSSQRLPQRVGMARQHALNVHSIEAMEVGRSLKYPTAQHEDLCMDPQNQHSRVQYHGLHL